MVKILEEKGTMMILHTLISSRHTIHHRMGKAIMVTSQGTGCLDLISVLNLRPLQVNPMNQFISHTAVATMPAIALQPASTR